MSEPPPIKLAHAVTVGGVIALVTFGIGVLVGVEVAAPSRNSPPVIITGGSVDADAKYGWASAGGDQTAPRYLTSVIAEPLNLYMNNLTSGDGTAAPTTLPLSSTWKVKLIFNDANDSLHHWIALNGESASSSGQFIFMQGNGDGRWIPSAGPNGYSRESYQVQTCHGNSVSGESDCNHLVKIEISGSGAEADYNCPPVQDQPNKKCIIKLGP